MNFDRTYFSTLLKDPNISIEDDGLDDYIDITESIDVKLNDDTIDLAECKIIAYNVQVDETDDTLPYNQKNNPDKAIKINFSFPDKNLNIEIFLDTESCEWDSLINGKTKLSPEQMGQFFKSNFYGMLKNKLENTWPNNDPQFGKLLEALRVKKYKIDFISENENSEKINEGDYRFKRHNVKLGKSREKNAAGEQIRTNSGRLIIDFSDQNVKNDGEGEAYYSWPGRRKDWFRWSRWCDWEKQKPFLRLRFRFGIGQYSDLIGVSLSLFEEDDENRGFKSFNLSLEPILQYLTPQETQDILGLSIVRRYLRESLKRLNYIMSMSDEEIYQRVGNPEKCSIDDIRKTKRIVKNTLKAVKDPRADTFIYN